MPESLKCAVSCTQARTSQVECQRMALEKEAALKLASDKLKERLRRSAADEV